MVFNLQNYVIFHLLKKELKLTNVGKQKPPKVSKRNKSTEPHSTDHPRGRGMES